MMRIELAELDRRRRFLIGRGASPIAVNRDRLSPRFVRRQLENPVPGVEPGISTQQLEELMTGLFSLTKPTAEMNSADLLQLHQRVRDKEEPALREIPVEPFCPRQLPVAPNLVARALDRFFEWVGGESFQQLHPVEQISIAQMRLLEIHPFHRRSQATCFVFCCRFLLAAGHLLPLPGDPRRFVQALDQAYAFSTQPLIEWNLRAGLRAHDEAEL